MGNPEQPSSTQYYKLKEAAQNLTDDQKAALFSGWIGMLER
jgi:hypothetical protein